MNSNIKKISTIAASIALVAFIAFAGFTTFSVTHLSTTVDEVVARMDAEIEAGPTVRSAPDTIANNQTSTAASDPMDGNASFAEPLGATADTPSVSTVARTTAAITVPDQSMTVAIIAIVVSLGIFAAALIAFLLISRRSHKKRY